MPVSRGQYIQVYLATISMSLVGKLLNCWKSKHKQSYMTFLSASGPTLQKKFKGTNMLEKQIFHALVTFLLVVTKY